MTFLLLQGSEIDTVVYVLGSPIYQDWQHVYTAVTRGVRQVIVVNDPNHLKKAVTVNEPFQRKTKLREFLVKDLELPCVSEESDPETDSTNCAENDDVFHSQSLDKGCSPFVYHPASTTQIAGNSANGDLFSLNQILETPDSSCYAASNTVNTRDDKTWEDEFTEECDDEVLAWALEIESSQHQGLSSTEYAGNYNPAGIVMMESFESTGLHDDVITAGGFHIARSNLNIKKEKYPMECGMEGNSHSLVAHSGDQSAVASGDFLAARNGTRVESEKQERGMVESASGPFSGRLAGLSGSGINSFSSTVHHGSPIANSTDNSPKTCPRRFSESSAFPTPPRTPPNFTNTTPPKHLSNTFPRKSNSQRTPFRKSGGTPAKGRRSSFTARYNAWCPMCKMSISAGVDEITHSNNGSTKSWVHQKCIQSKSD